MRDSSRCHLSETQWHKVSTCFPKTDNPQTHSCYPTACFTGTGDTWHEKIEILRCRSAFVSGRRYCRRRTPEGTPGRENRCRPTPAHTKCQNQFPPVTRRSFQRWNLCSPHIRNSRWSHHPSQPMTRVSKRAKCCPARPRNSPPALPRTQGPSRSTARTASVQ